MVAKMDLQLQETAKLKYIVQTKLESKASSEKTNIGRSALELLQSSKSITNFDPIEGESSLLQDEEYSQVDKLNEEGLIDLVFCKLQNALNPRAVVCSERSPWLMTSSNHDADKQKPDVFITHPATFVTSKSSSRPVHVVCGVPAHIAFYQGLGFIDFKGVPSNKAFGDVVVHAELLCENIRAHCPSDHFPTIKCALASKEGIWLVTFSGGTPIDMTKMKWTDNGSVSTLRNFFREENRTALILDELLLSMNFRAISFLGAGAMGCVFQVCPVACSRPSIRDTQALKVVIGEKNCSRLSDEYKHNKFIFQLKEDVAVVKAIELYFCQSGKGAGMLMEECGTKVLTLTRQKIQYGLGALASVHSTKHHHGDARIANLLICTGIYKWCDLQYAYVHEHIDARKISFGKDIMTLMSSLGKEAPFDSTNFKEILDGYVETQDTKPLLKFILEFLVPPRNIGGAVEVDDVDPGDAAVSQLLQCMEGAAPAKLLLYCRFHWWREMCWIEQVIAW